MTALYAARIAFLQQTELMMSESGLVERVVDDKRYGGKISNRSFYNGLFIFLVIEVNSAVMMGNNSKQFITIYNDAISEDQYRLLARLINSGRN